MVTTAPQNVLVVNIIQQILTHQIFFKAQPRGIQKNWPTKGFGLVVRRIFQVVVPLNAWLFPVKKTRKVNFGNCHEFAANFDKYCCKFWQILIILTNIFGIVRSLLQILTPPPWSTACLATHPASHDLPAFCKKIIKCQNIDKILTEYWSTVADFQAGFHLFHLYQWSTAQWLTVLWLVVPYNLNRNLHFSEWVVLKYCWQYILTCSSFHVIISLISIISILIIVLNILTWSSCQLKQSLASSSTSRAKRPSPRKSKLAISVEPCYHFVFILFNFI